MKFPKSCRKRNGDVVPFDARKIEHALTRCLEASGYTGPPDAAELIVKLTNGVINTLGATENDEPSVEDVQRLVIQQLWARGLFPQAEHYQNYREERRKARFRAPLDPEVQRRFDEMKEHFPTDLQAYQFMSKFSRWREADNRRETWRECTYERVTPWLFKLPGVTLTEQEKSELQASMYALETSPAMRVVQMAGPALDRCHVGAYNCAYHPLKDIFSFVELLYILMQGTGAGFSVEEEYVSQLPRIRKQNGKVAKLVCEDSTESWCDTFHRHLEMLWEGWDTDVDVTRVRPKGAVLKTKGGRASGPGPFLELISFTRALIKARQGRFLEDVDAHDIACKIGGIVQVGGVRRAAMISLSDLRSRAMREAKTGNWYTPATKHRTMANNSAVYEEMPPVEVFMEEWLSLVKSKSGERGIFNRQAANQHKPARRVPWVFGCNPCAEIILRPFEFCVAAHTPLITRKGLSRIDEEEGKTVEVWNGKKWSQVEVRKTGTERELVRVTFSDGSFLDCTPEHRFSVSTTDSRYKFGPDHWMEVQAKDLKPKMATEIFVIQHSDGESPRGNSPPWDAYTLGVLVGDGHVERVAGKYIYACVDLYGEKIDLPVRGSRGRRHTPAGYNVECVRVNSGAEYVDRMERIRADEEAEWRGLFRWSRSEILFFLAGWFDTDGSHTGGHGVRLYVSGRYKADMIQLLLTKCGIRSSVCLMARAGDETGYGKRGADVWYVSVTDCGELPCKRLDTSTGHAPTNKGKFQTIKSVEWLPGRHDTFCFEEPEEHKAVFNNTLTYQCNLSIAIARPRDTIESLRHKVRLATYWGKIQSLATDFKYIRSDWKANCTDERLLGVDITGHADCPLLQFNAHGRAELIRELGREVQKVDHLLSARWGVRVSAANTTIKPSGDSAVMFNSASGVSPWFADYQIRWVREQKGTPVDRYLRDAGVPHADAPERPDELTVFGFPRQAPSGATTRDQMTALQQLENWLEWKTNWAEHSVSATIYVEDHEWPDVGAWVYHHFDQITGLSFLPKDNGIYTYAPNEALTKQKFEEMQAQFPTLNWAKLTQYEDTDQTTARQTFACVGGSCE